MCVVAHSLEVVAHNLFDAGALYVCGSGEEGRLGLGHLVPFQVDMLD